MAQGFARVAWPAFGVTVLTGMWNLMAVDITAMSSAYQATVLLHIAVAIVAGIFVAIHSAGKSTLSIAVGGAVGALASVARAVPGHPAPHRHRLTTLLPTALASAPSASSVGPRPPLVAPSGTPNQTAARTGTVADRHGGERLSPPRMVRAMASRDHRYEGAVLAPRTTPVPRE